MPKMHFSRNESGVRFAHTTLSLRMVRADVFLRAPWRFSAERLRRALHFLAGIRAAGGGGGACSSYFKYSGPNRKAQVRASRLASLGGQSVLHFRAEFELAISHSGKMYFWHSLFALEANQLV